MSPWLKSPGASAGTSSSARAQSAESVVTAREPRQHPAHVAVEDRQPAAESDRGDGAGGVAADAGQRGDRLLVVGEDAAVALDDDARRGVQVACSPVVAEAGPEPEDVVERRGGELAHRREARHPSLPVGAHGLEPGLLRHDLADPDGVGVTRVTPGEVAAVAAVVGDDARGEILQAAPIMPPGVAA
jgi:hypothetical protein